MLKAVRVPRIPGGVEDMGLFRAAWGREVRPGLAGRAEGEGLAPIAPYELMRSSGFYYRYVGL